MRRYVFSFALLATAVLGPPMAMANDHDQQIAETIVERLKAQKQAGNLKGFSLDLQVEEGEVWLTGRVSSEAQQNLALDIARRVPGVRQVVNDITVEASAKPTASRNLFASIGGKVRQAVGQVDQAEPTPIGTGVDGGTYYAGAAAAPAPIPAPAIAGPLPQQYAGPMPHPYYARPNLPMAFAPAHTIAYQNGVPAPPDALGAGPVNGQPMPMHIPGTALGMAPARYDHPHMPGYAWPSYASYPNYGAVTYPKQYSPTAWPYIGPFYPYPQVPLGWRKVTLEWDDGWWMLDFKDRRH